MLCFAVVPYRLMFHLNPARAQSERRASSTEDFSTIEDLLDPGWVAAPGTRSRVWELVRDLAEPWQFDEPDKATFSWRLLEVLQPFGKRYSPAPPITRWIVQDLVEPAK